jgi:hypothetical protein
LQDTATRNRFYACRRSQGVSTGSRNTAIGSLEYPWRFKHSDGTWANRRIDQVPADGSIAVGRQQAEWGGWLGTVWHNGRPELIVDANGNPVS